MVLPIPLNTSYLGQNTILFTRPSILNELTNYLKKLPSYLLITIKC